MHLINDNCDFKLGCAIVKIEVNRIEEDVARVHDAGSAGLLAFDVEIGENVNKRKNDETEKVVYTVFVCALWRYGLNNSEPIGHKERMTKIDGPNKVAVARTCKQAECNHSSHCNSRLILMLNLYFRG